MSKKVFISADHGMAIIYFLQSDVVPTLLNAGVEIVVLTDDETKDQIAKRFGSAEQGRSTRRDLPSKACASNKPMTMPPNSNRVCNGWSSTCAASAARGASIPKPWTATSGKSGRRTAGNFVWAFGFRPRLQFFYCGHFPFARKFLVRMQNRFIPRPNLYADLFEKYEPDLVIASTAGWRLDRYLLREATLHHVPTMAAIVGWDNPSSYSISGAHMDYATCWSQLQKDELVYGSDWNPERVNIGGIPSYDGYFRKEWQLSKDDYFKLHRLDPNRKLISYACSFVHFAPNYPECGSACEIGFIQFVGRAFAIVDPLASESFPR